MSKRPVDYYMVKIPTSKFLDRMNPFTGCIITRFSYLRYITSAEFLNNVRNGYIGLYINSCSPLNDDKTVKDDIITTEFIEKYRLGIVYEATEEYISVCLSKHLDKEIIEYIKENADKCSAGMFGISNERMEGLDVVSDVTFITGFQLYDIQYRPPVDIIFKMGETYKERCRKYAKYGSEIHIG